MNGGSVSPWLVVTGLALLPLGTLPLLLYYTPYADGTGDRAFAVSSVGAAMVWTG